MSRSEINRLSEILRCKTQKLEKRQARRGASAKLSECKLFSNFQSPKPVWRRLPRPGAIFRLQRDNEKENRGWRILLKIKQKSFFVHFQWKYCGEFRILPQLRCEIGILLVFARIENKNMLQQYFHVSFYYHITAPDNYFPCDFIVMTQSDGALVVSSPRLNMRYVFASGGGIMSDLS